MRFRILTILLFCGFVSKGQLIYPWQQTKTITTFKGGFQVDSFASMPIRDTIGWNYYSFRDLGRLTVRPQDSILYFHNGTRWISLINTGSGSGDLLISNYISKEVPNGLIDGSNTIFTLDYVPELGTEIVKLNGLEQDVGILNDYTISGNIITFNTAPLFGFKILVTYIKQ